MLDHGARQEAPRWKRPSSRRELIQDLAGQVRDFSQRLRPSMLDDLGLVPALLWHLERCTAQTGVRVDFRHAGLGRRISADGETAAYRIVQEALTNVARHAGVGAAAVRIALYGDGLHLQIEDRGPGFDAEAALRSGAACGLSGMRQRTARLGGRLEIASAPARGRESPRSGRRRTAREDWMALTLVVADDHRVVRQALCALLDAVAGLKVIGQAADGNEAARLLERLRPDVLVIDLTMPGLPGVEVVGRTAKLSPRTRAVVLSVHNNEGYVVAALRTGATGYVLKESDSEILIRAIREAAAGRQFIDPAVAPLSLQEYVRKVREHGYDLMQSLTAREREVFQLTAEGHSGADVAERLFISPRTVETHRANLRRKLGLRNHKELIRYAAQRGLLPRGDEPPAEGKGL